MLACPRASDSSASISRPLASRASTSMSARRASDASDAISAKRTAQGTAEITSCAARASAAACSSAARLASARCSATAGSAGTESRGSPVDARDGIKATSSVAETEGPRRHGPSLTCRQTCGTRVPESLAASHARTTGVSRHVRREPGDGQLSAPSHEKSCHFCHRMRYSSFLPLPRSPTTLWGM